MTVGPIVGHLSRTVEAMAALECLGLEFLSRETDSLDGVERAKGTGRSQLQSVDSQHWCQPPSHHCYLASFSVAVRLQLHHALNGTTGKGRTTIASYRRLGSCRPALHDHDTLPHIERQLFCSNHGKAHQTRQQTAPEATWRPCCQLCSSITRAIQGNITASAREAPRQAMLVSTHILAARSRMARAAGDRAADSVLERTGPH